MNSAFDELKEDLKIFGKKAQQINDMHNDLIYKGKPLGLSFDTVNHFQAIFSYKILLNEAIEQSQQLHTQMNRQKDVILNVKQTPQKKEEFESMQHEFFRYLDQIQEIQTKIIERKKDNLRSYNKSLYQRQRSQISGLRSQMSLGTGNNLGESKYKDKSFTTANNEKSESFVRFSNQNSQSTPNNRMMYQESGGSSVLDEDSPQEYSDLELSGDPSADYEKIQKAATNTENEINEQQNKLNMMIKIQSMIKKEQELKEQQKIEDEQKKKEYQSYQASISSHASSINNVPHNNNAKNSQHLKNQNRNQSTIVSSSNNNNATWANGNGQDDCYVQIQDIASSQETQDQGTSYEQSKKKKCCIIAIASILVVGIIFGLVFALK